MVKQNKRKNSNSYQQSKSSNQQDINKKQSSTADEFAVSGKNHREKGKTSEKSKKNKQYFKNSTDQDDINFNNFLKTECGLTFLVMRGDGNCLFRSLAHQLSFFQNDNNHMRLRLEICSYLEEHKDYFRLFLDEDEENIDSYIEEMKEFGCWGGNLELYAVAQLYQLSIAIFQWDSLSKYMISCLDENITNSKNQEKGLRIIHLSYHGNCHYNSVVPISIFSATASSSSSEISSALYQSVKPPSSSSSSSTPASSSSSSSNESVEIIWKSVPWVKKEEILLALEWSENNIDNSIDLLCGNLESIQIALKEEGVDVIGGGSDEAKRERREKDKPKQEKQEKKPENRLIDDKRDDSRPNEKGLSRYSKTKIKNTDTTDGEEKEKPVISSKEEKKKHKEIEGLSKKVSLFLFWFLFVIVDVCCIFHRKEGNLKKKKRKVIRLLL
jgi:hypothetical protein